MENFIEAMSSYLLTEVMGVFICVLHHPPPLHSTATIYKSSFHDLPLGAGKGCVKRKKYIETYLYVICICICI